MMRLGPSASIIDEGDLVLGEVVTALRYEAFWMKKQRHEFGNFCAPMLLTQTLNCDNLVTIHRHGETSKTPRPGWPDYNIFKVEKDVGER